MGYYLTYIKPISIIFNSTKTKNLLVPKTDL